MIVLEILKIIGIVLACVVGLVIVLVLLVLFAPVRYRIEAEGEGFGIGAKARIGWLFGLAKVTLHFQEKKLKYRASVLWFNLAKGTVGEDEVEVLKEALQDESVASDRKEYARISKELDEAEERAEKSAAKKAEKQAEKEQKKEEKKQKKEEKKIEKKEEREKKKEEAKEKTFREKVADVRAKIESIREKYERAQKIWNSRVTRRAARHVKAVLFRLLNHIKPTKLAGHINYGLEDPANTAILYGNFALLLETASKGNLLIVPEFYKHGVELKLLIKGRIFLGYMLLCFLQLYFDRDLQRVIKVIRRYTDGR